MEDRRGGEAIRMLGAGLSYFGFPGNLSDGPKVCTVYKNIFEFKKKKKRKHTHGILSTGTYYKRESNQINGHVLVLHNS